MHDACMAPVLTNKSPSLVERIRESDLFGMLDYLFGAQERDCEDFLYQHSASYRRSVRTNRSVSSGFFVGSMANVAVKSVIGWYNFSASCSAHPTCDGISALAHQWLSVTYGLTGVFKGAVIGAVLGYVGGYVGHKYRDAQYIKKHRTFPAPSETCTRSISAHNKVE